MSDQRSTSVVLGVLTALLSAAGCGDDGSSRVCAPGATQACLCTGGGFGVQICRDDGSGWGSCDCGGADADADADGDGGADADGDADAADAGDVPPPPARGTLDLLFVIDDSSGMAEEQVTLVGGMPGFLEALFADAAAASRDLSLNVGVVSTDMGSGGYTTCPDPIDGDNGCLLSEPNPLLSSCDPTYPPFLARTASTAGGYTTAQMADDFRCIATLGSNGCGFEQPFKAATTALTVNPTSGLCNTGFLRADSTVAVVFLSSESDCSVQSAHGEIFNQDRTDLGHLAIRCFLHPDFLVPVDETLTALRGLETAGHALFVGAIVGVPPSEASCNGFGNAIIDCLTLPAMQEQIDPVAITRLIPACESAGTGQADPGVRFVQLAQALEHQAYVSSICSADYGPALAAIADALF